MFFIRYTPLTKAPALQRSRKLYHMVGLLIPMGIESDFFFLAPFLPISPRQGMLLFLLFLTIALFIIESFRLRGTKLNDIYFRYFGAALKKEEKQHYVAMLPYLISFCLLLMFFPTTLITISALSLILADPCAAFIGTRFGRLKFPNGKSLEGFVSFALVSFLLAALYLYIKAGYGSHADLFVIMWRSKAAVLLLPLAISSLCAALAELLSSSNACKGLLDDNFNVPIASSFGLALSMYYFTDYPFSLLVRFQAF